VATQAIKYRVYYTDMDKDGNIIPGHRDFEAENEAQADKMAREIIMERRGRQDQGVYERGWEE